MNETVTHLLAAVIGAIVAGAIGGLAVMRKLGSVESEAMNLRRGLAGLEQRTNERFNTLIDWHKDTMNLLRTVVDQNTAFLAELRARNGRQHS